MRKIILAMNLLISILFSNEGELQFWDQVKDSSDIELLKLYKQQYPHGVFEPLADIKIKRLNHANTKKDDVNTIPQWISGKTADYEYYGIGKSNKHFKGKYYQENLARSRARKNIQKKFDTADLTQKEIYNYTKLIQEKRYTDTKERIYILLYIDNYDL